MKKDWEIKKISDACEIVKDKPEKFKGIKNYYSTGAINNSGNYDEPEKITYIGRPSRANIYPKDGDVGFAKMKLTNKVLRIDNSLNGSVFSTGFCFLRPRKFLDNKFLYYFIISDLFQELKDFYAGDGIMGGIKNSALENIKIPLPPLLEQKNIVKILDEVFEKIEKVKENAEKNLKNSKEIFESYLQSIFVKPGKDWEEKKLGDTYDVRDGTHDSPKYQKDGYALITSKNLKRDELDYQKIKYISENDYKKINERSKVHKGDVLFAMIGTIGNPVVIRIEPNFAIKNVALFKIPKEQDSYFLKYFLDSKFVIDKMTSESKGTTQKFVSLGYLRNFKIQLPKINEQKSIVTRLDALSNETKKLEKTYQEKLTDLEDLKKSILKRAFNGDL